MITTGPHLPHTTPGVHIAPGQPPTQRICNGPGNVRDSLHRETTAGDVDRFLAELPDLVTRLRAEAGMVGWRPLTRTVRP